MCWITPPPRSRATGSGELDPGHLDVFDDQQQALDGTRRRGGDASTDEKWSDKRGSSIFGEYLIIRPPRLETGSAVGRPGR
jgi:hypothetical protein